MNVNGSRFHMLFGRPDWAACRIADGSTETALGTFWHGADGDLLPDDAVPPGVPHWDARRSELTLAPVAASLPATLGEPILQPEQRRAAATDSQGNLYFPGDDGTSLRMVPPGSDEAQRFWPDDRAFPPPFDSAFAPAEPLVPDARRYVALAATGNGYLVAWWTSDRGDGADRFDLIGGGEPEVLAAASGMPGRIIGLAPRGQGGAWGLLEGGGGIVALDHDLRPCAEQPATFDDDAFQPATAAAGLRRHAAAWHGAAVALPAGHAARQIAIARVDVPIVLTDTVAGTAVLAFDPAGRAWRVLAGDTERWHLIAPGPIAGADEQSLFLVPPTGNQAIERLFGTAPDGMLTLGPTQPHTYPLRRFGGRLLAVAGDRLTYDSGDRPRFVPVVARRQLAYVERNRFQTPICDSRIEQCHWDRIRIDASIPPGTGVLIEARCGDTAAAVERSGEAGWIVQPAPYLNGDNGELPGIHDWAAKADRAVRRGCWDLLLQGQRGRFCQLRITLAGDGRNTPRLRALRLWYPRFSYVERFLPALYREDESSADFLDRFLANLEGVNTTIEDRIAQAQALFDPRIAPTELVEWLASWFDLLLDPAWQPDRKRLFLANAMRFFGWRGTVGGLELALRIAFDETLDETAFMLGAGACQSPGRIRIVENFSVHRRARRFASTVAANTGPAAHSLAAAWQPGEGSAGLWQRLAAAGDAPEAGAFPLYPRATLDASAWAGTVAAAFGFTPAAGGDERAAWMAFREDRGEPPIELPRQQVPPGADAASWQAFLALPSRARGLWQEFLRRRYRRIERLNAAHAAGWSGFEAIALVAELPDRETATIDWIEFEGEVLPRSRSAHRFSVLLPVRTVSEGSAQLADRMALAQRIVATEKPAHTDFDVRFYWAMNRVGEARLGQDSELGTGSRAAELIPPTLLGASYIGSSFLAGPQGSPPERTRLAC